MTHPPVQIQLPGDAEHAQAARQWVADQITHPYAETLAGELFAAVLATEPSVVLMTVSTYGRRVRITAYAPRPITLAALNDVSRTILSTLADRHGIAPDGCGIYAEIEVSR